MPPRKAASKRKEKQEEEETVEEETTVTETVAASGETTTETKKRRVTKKAVKGAETETLVEETNETETAEPAGKGKKKAAAPKRRVSVGEDDEAKAVRDDKEPSAPKLKKAASTGISREALRAPSAHEGRKLTLCSWNVNGLRAIINNNASALADLVNAENIDVLCLQEHKLQEQNVDSMRNIIPGFKSFWSCSKEKKGYSGTAVFVRNSSPGESQAETKGKVTAFFTKAAGGKKKGKKADETAEPAAEEATAAAASEGGEVTNPECKVVNVTYEIPGHPEALAEGRVVTVEFEHFFLVNVYVPNSGMSLDRLEYRLKKWNTDLTKYCKELEKKKPVIVTGDLNVAHLDVDIYNVEANHVKKIAGCTPQEREAFGEFLAQGFVDTFRRQHGDVKGAFTYWSMRTGGRTVDKGLRLDYFVCSGSLYDHKQVRPHHTFQLPQYHGSDHCPVAITLAVGPF